MRVHNIYYSNHIEILNKMIPSLVPSIFWAKKGGHLIISNNVGMVYDWMPESFLLLLLSISRLHA
jgi:hypothetical protein